MSLTSFIGTTYAPRGQRPVLTISTEITRRLYVISGISPTGDLRYHCREKPFDAQAIIAFLQQMLTIYEGKLLIIWDNASIHDCAATRTFLTTDARAGRLHLAKQPTYTPEVNADEQVWQQLKCVQFEKYLFPDSQRTTTPHRRGDGTFTKDPVFDQTIFPSPRCCFL